MPESREVTDFFSNWATYRAVIETDSMEHRRVYAGVHEVLAERTTPYALLDLGCGDAAGTAPAMRGTPVARYIGVDCAEPALSYARTMLAGLPAQVDLRVGDLLETVEGMPADDDGGDLPAMVDVILVSFALHHLGTAAKRRFLAVARDRLAPGGELLLVDVVRREGETRADYVARYEQFVATWPVSPDTRARVMTHVSGYDFPEPLSVQPDWARELGFGRVEEFYRGASDTQAAWRLVR